MSKYKHRVCFLDFETTGSNLFEDDPIQIGAILVDIKTNEVISEFESNIRPSSNVSNTTVAFQTHGINLEDLNSAPKQGEVLESFFETVGTDYCFAGWNISFDVPFFRKMCYKNDFYDLYNKINYRHIDVQSICRLLKLSALIDEDLYSLSDFADYFKLRRSKKHTALEDVYITYEVFSKALNFFKSSKSINQDLFIQ
ncbi:MAG: 3'-5' exonuclease [Balneolaceae bacterium]